MTAKYLIFTIVVCAMAYHVHAQSNRLIKEGNKLYAEKKYQAAAADYMGALKKDNSNIPGLFNLGNSLYQQKQYDVSRQAFANTYNKAQNKVAKSDAAYNYGNTYMEQQKWQDAIDAYKNALKANPQDGDAKYNLSYAEEMLKKQQQQNKNQKNKNDKNKQEQNKNQQNKNDKNKQDKNNQNKQDQNKNQQDKNDKNQQGQQPQAMPSKLSQQQADQLLNALQREEQKLQDKKDKEKGVPVKMEKDW